AMLENPFALALAQSPALLGEFALQSFDQVLGAQRHTLTARREDSAESRVLDLRARDLHALGQNRQYSQRRCGALTGQRLHRLAPEFQPARRVRPRKLNDEPNAAQERRVDRALLIRRE